MPRTLYLIDGYAQIFRAYYAIRGGMRSPVTSEPTHAIFGFTGMLLKLLSQFHPHYVAVALDAPGKTFRDEMYADYKATRNATPDDLISQIPRILELIDLFGIPCISQPGLEADDVIACIVSRILADPQAADVDVRIVSKDKDLAQLMGPRVSMFDIHTDTEVDVETLFANKGIRPDQVVDVLALMGDTVDNVPGVEGIGPKTAAQLVTEYGSIDGIMANLDKIPGKKRENLEKAREKLPLWRELVALKCDVDLPFTLESAEVRPIRLEPLIGLFRQLGFNRYQDEARRLAGAAGSVLQPEGVLPGFGPPAPGGEQSGQAGLADSGTLGLQDESNGIRGQSLANSSAPLGVGGLQTPNAQRPTPGSYRAITTPAELEELVGNLRAAPLVAVDTETTGLEKDAALCGICLAWEEAKGVYVPTLSPESDQHLDTETVLAALRPVLEDPAVPKCGHNLKFDAHVLLRNGVRMRGVVFDTMLAAQLIDPSQPNKLDSLAESVLGCHMIPITDLIGTGTGQTSMAEVPLDKITAYAAEDADISLRLCHAQQPAVTEMGIEELVTQVESPLSVVLAEMEANGILCDPKELERQGEALRGRVEELRREVFRLCEYEFALDSTKQLAEALFDRLGLKPGRKTKTGRSTDAEVLETLAAQEDRSNPCTAVPRLVLEYRQLAKLISTYLGNLRDAISPRDGRIHTTFHQLVTATGRLASNNPNLQNIPVRTDIGKQIRKAFKAPLGHMLIAADYSQIELRILAHCSEDPALLDAFRQGQDIHAAVAAQVFGVDPNHVPKELRDRAKTINFGIIYGVTPFGLARRIEGLDVPSATRLIADYKARFPGIDRFLNQCITEAMEYGYVKTLMGRRRSIPEIRATSATTRALGERLAINSVIQGSAADLIKVAMVRVHHRIEQESLPMKLLLQIHDELVLEAPEESARSHADLVCEEMERAMQLSIPLKAECGIGPDWFSAK